MSKRNKMRMSAGYGCARCNATFSDAKYLRLHMDICPSAAQPKQDPAKGHDPSAAVAAFSKASDSTSQSWNTRHEDRRRSGSRCSRRFSVSPARTPLASPDRSRRESKGNSSRTRNTSLCSGARPKEIQKPKRPTSDLMPAAPNDSKFLDKYFGGDFKSTPTDSIKTVCPQLPKRPTSNFMPAAPNEAPTPMKKATLEVLKGNVRDGTLALLDENYKVGAQMYNRALGLLRSNSNHYKGYSEEEVVLLKYLYAKCCLYLHTTEDIRLGMQILEEIIEKHYCCAFPLVYYLKGVAFVAQNRFKEALDPLEKLNRIIEKIKLRTFYYPEAPTLTAVIEESLPKNLKVLLSDLLTRCKNPPQPDAVCRHGNCDGHERSLMYYTDPEFLGFVQVICSERCRVQFHVDCWRELLNGKHISRIKDFLGTPCITPDCKSVVKKISVIGVDGEIRKECVPEITGKNISKKHPTETFENSPKKCPTKTQPSSKNDVEQSRKKRNKSSNSCSSAEAPTNRSRSTSECTEPPTFSHKSTFADTRMDADKIILKPGIHNSQRLAQNLGSIEPRFSAQKGNRKRLLSQAATHDGKCISNAVSMEVINYDLERRNALTDYLTSCIKYTVAADQNMRAKVETSCPLVDSDTSLYNVSQDVDESVEITLTEYLRNFIESRGPTRLSSWALLNEIAVLPTEAQEVLLRHNGIDGFISGSPTFEVISGVVLFPKHYRTLPMTSDTLLYTLDLAIPGRSSKSNPEISRFSSLHNLSLSLPEDKGASRISLESYTTSTSLDKSSVSSKTFENCDHPVKKRWQSSMDIGSSVNNRVTSHQANQELCGDVSDDGQEMKQPSRNRRDSAPIISCETLDLDRPACSIRCGSVGAMTPIKQLIEDAISVFLKQMNELNNTDMARALLSWSKMSNKLFPKSCPILPEKETIYLEKACGESSSNDLPDLLEESQHKYNSLLDQFNSLKDKNFGLQKEISLNKKQHQTEIGEFKSKCMKGNEKFKDLSMKYEASLKKFESERTKLKNKFTEKSKEYEDQQETWMRISEKNVLLQETLTAMEFNMESLKAENANLKKFLSNKDEETWMTDEKKHSPQNSYSTVSKSLAQNDFIVAPRDLPNLSVVTTKPVHNRPMPSTSAIQQSWRPLGQPPCLGPVPNKVNPKTGKGIGRGLPRCPKPAVQPAAQLVSFGAFKLPSCSATPWGLSDNADSQNKSNSEGMLASSTPGSMHYKIDESDSTEQRSHFPSPAAVPIPSTRQTFYDRIISRLSSEFPLHSREALKNFVAIVRKKNGDKLTGMPVNEIVEFVRQEIFHFLVSKEAARIEKNASSLEQNTLEDIGDVCPICTEDINVGELDILQCQHVFHKKCIKNWYSIQETCPMCRTFAKLEEDYPCLG